MFYKGTLKSYDSTNQVGIILLSEKDIELHFSLSDFPNSVLEPQIGERVKCLIEEVENKHIAKFIVRLDHKNARTEQPRNNIFYSEEEDLYVLKKAQQEKENATKQYEEGNLSTDSSQGESKTQTEGKQSLHTEKPQENIVTDPLQKETTSTAHTQQKQLESDLSVAKNEQIEKDKAEQEKAESSNDSSMSAESNNADAEHLAAQQQEVDHSTTTAGSAASNKEVEAADSAESVQVKPVVEEDSSSLVVSTAYSTTEATQQEKVAVSVPVLNAEDEIKLHQTLPLSALTQVPANQPVDVNILGTLDLSHPTELKDFVPPKATEALVTPSAQSIHLGQPKPIKPTEMSPFEQLQRELGSRHTTSVPDRSGAQVQQDHAKNNQLQTSDLNSSDTTSNNQKSVSVAEDESQLQKVKTQLAYKTHKIKPQRKATLNINPWIIMGLISLGLVAVLGYFGFQKYLQYKEEQEAKARYYLLEQQKAIEDQRKRMAKLSDKPIIPEHRRKELLGDSAK